MANALALLGGSRAITRRDELAAVSRWPVFGDEEKQAVLEALDASNIYGVTAEFEREFAAYHDARYSLATNNGTSTLHTAYFAAGVQPGDEVLTSSYTWHLQVTPILALHALPVFCDIDPETGCIDPDDLRKKITSRTRVIVVVHAYGAVAPMNEIMAIAREHGLPVIEDASHAHGATYHGRKIGTLGDIGCFSLQGAKLMTGIEGGIIITNNEEYYERSCLLAHYERLPSLRHEKYSKYHRPSEPQAPTSFGFKYRMHPLAAALSRVQLRHLDEGNRVRGGNMLHLSRRIAELDGALLRPPHNEPGVNRTWLGYMCQYHRPTGGVRRDRIVEALQAEGVPATGGRAGYLPIYWNPLYQERSMWADGDPFDAPYVSRTITYERGLCPEAEQFWQRTVGLPVLHRETSPELLDELAGAVEKVFHNLEALRE
jgi:dTDP-4-amino-4,6-dideoxygalactose transaminase